MIRPIAALAVLLLPSIAIAQDTGRYSMERTEAGIVRLDTASGQVSLCIEGSGGLTCRLAADERAALESEIDRLENRIRILEKTAIEPPPAPKPAPGTDEQIDQAIGIMERMMRSFMGIVKDFEGSGESRPPEPAPDPSRT